MAAENPVAENMFLKWVTGARIVLATCDAAFGNKIKLRYPHVKPFSTPVAPSLASNKNFNALDESPNPSAIAFVVNLPASGLTVNSSLKNDVRYLSNSTISWLGNASAASNASSKKKPLEPPGVLAVTVFFLS